MPPAVEVAEVWKEYRSYGAVTGGLKRFLLRLPESVRTLRQRLPALQAVSFEVERGEAFGVIGDNGSGKSTLLGLLAGVLRPTRGRVTVNGHVSALLELGAGFHPELTGRENVMLNGVLLGLDRRQIRRRFDAIVEFAELSEYMDQPLRTYSSGMLARLGFSVVAHLEPDVLLVDEVLAVGDVRFQKKCLQKLHQFKEQGVTIVLVSHALADVERICDRALWLDRGRVAALGDAKTVIHAYASGRA